MQASLDGISNEILCSVLEYTSLKSDLKALCQVSKALHQRVIPRLYRDVELYLWHTKHDNLQRLLRSIPDGAGYGLRYTRSIRFEDSRPPLEPECQHFGRLGFKLPSGEQYNSDVKYSWEHVESWLLMVLEMIPDNQLHSFQFVSTRSLSLQVFRHLQDRQEQIRRLQMNWGGLPRDGISRRPGQSFDHLNAVDICLDGSEGFVRLFERIRLSGWRPPSLLERLSLSIDPTIVSDDMKRAAITREIPKLKKIPTLKELSLNGFDLDDPFDGLDQLADFTALQRISIMGCKNADKFLRKLGTIFRSGKPRLKHLALTMNDDTGCADDILISCESLKSLHMQSLRLPLPILCPSPQPLPSSLRTLAMEPVFPAGFDDFMDDDEFKVVCKKCPNLQFLGYHIKEEDLYPETWKWGLGKFLEHFQYLPALRVVHFRWPHAIENGGSDWFRPPNEATFLVQRFANALFEWMDEHKICPRLQGLIFGMHWDIERHLNHQKQLGVARHCFVKGYQIDAFERKTAVGVPVPAYMIRQLEPDCDLLDFDPNNKWIGNLPGRYHRL